VKIRLRDGRHLGYEEHGGGRPLIWLVGTPGSRLWQPPDARALAQRNLRLIVVERPGFGDSDPQPARRILDWPDDLAQLADALGLERFLCAGTSGAGPYLHACGARLHARIDRLGVIACFAPFLDGMPLWRRAVLRAARLAPSLVERALPRDPAAFYRRMTADAPPCDRPIVARIWDAQVAMTAEALKQGPRAFVEELILGASPWGFSLEEVRAEVILWHGSEDAATPVEAARRVARTLPRCTARFVDGAGHFLHYDRWGEVLDSLTR
jgi:pimeloyl-ACP methyl ester carboxylesterase